MPGVVNPTPTPDPTPTDIDADLFADLFDEDSEGAVAMLWERAVECDCGVIDPDTRQPRWGQDCPECNSQGVRYLPGIEIHGLFRGRSQYQSYRRQGEFQHGEAQLTTPLAVCPNYTDRRLRDRLTIRESHGDSERGTVFFPATKPIPFIFAGRQRAWRVQVASIDQDQDLSA